MAKGFTLYELVVIMIILGVLATIAMAQYNGTIERSRGAEARGVLGTVRLLAESYRSEYDTIAGFNPAAAGIGTAFTQAPSACRASHFFRYSVSTADPTITVTATRCTSGGKTPQGIAGRTLVLTSNMATGDDTWSTNSGY